MIKKFLFPCSDIEQRVHFNICCFIAVAYTTLDRMRAFFNI